MVNFKWIKIITWHINGETQMSKDQAIGGAIFIVCLLVAVLYIVGIFFYPNIKPYLNIGTEENVRYWLVAVPVLIAFVAVLFIGAWIGWTMATTPPPKPIEEITTEIEEKKEEMKTEEPSEAAEKKKKP
jgi:predicted DNA-binding transcriptional regulator